MRRVIGNVDIVGSVPHNTHGIIESDLVLCHGLSDDVEVTVALAVRDSKRYRRLWIVCIRARRILSIRVTRCDEQPRGVAGGHSYRNAANRRVYRELNKVQPSYTR